MKLSDSRKLLLSILIVILFNVVVSYYFYRYTNQEMVDSLLYVIFFALTILGLWKGTLFSLGISLVIIFLLGSYTFWEQLTIESETNDQMLLPIVSMTIWQVSYIATSFFSGFCCKSKEAIIDKYRYWSKQYHDLVTIDPDTGFDNERRFYLHFHEQFKRSERYEDPFTLLLIRIKNWAEFEKLYGGMEAKHIVAQVAEKLKDITRASDSRFRISDDTFALILPSTSNEGTEIVIEKIVLQAKDYSLNRKERNVTLDFEFGFRSYDAQLEDDRRMLNDAMDELNHYIS